MPGRAASSNGMSSSAPTGGTKPNLPGRCARMRCGWSWRGSRKKKRANHFWRAIKSPLTTTGGHLEKCVNILVRLRLLRKEKRALRGHRGTSGNVGLGWTRYVNGPPAGWRKRAILDLTGRWLDAHRFSVAWVCGRKTGPEKGGLRSREGIPGGYVMVQFGRNNRVHKAVCQGCITLYFSEKPNSGKEPTWAVVRAGAFLSRLRGMGGSSAILFIVIYYTCSKIVTMKKSVAFLLHSLYSYGWESVPFAHRLQPARPPLPL